MCIPDPSNRTGSNSQQNANTTKREAKDALHEKQQAVSVVHPPQLGCEDPSTASVVASMSSSSTSTSHTAALTSTRVAQPGDVVTIDLDLQANDGFVPEPLFDSSGRISFVLDHGNYLPGVHELVRGRSAANDTTLSGIDIDAGYGAYRSDLVLSNVPLRKLQGLQRAGDVLAVGDTLWLGSERVAALVTQIDESLQTATLDLNPPLAGTSYNCRSLRIVEVAPSPWSKGSAAAPTHCSIATLALGCFWGAELFAMRIPGVVGTRVGYIGRSTEAVQVLYDRRVISYAQLIERALERSKELRESVVVGDDWMWEGETEHQDDDPEAHKYRHGIYCHDADQTAQAHAAKKRGDTMRIHCNVRIEAFQVAAPDQQQYLYKGGQSAKKNAKAPIRCFG